MDYFATDHWIEPERGDLLISEPYLPDPNFERTVILICEHDENGTFGYVLNKPAEAVFGDVVEEVKNFDAPLYVGGPVQQNSLHFIHRAPELLNSGKEVCDGIFWGGNFDDLLSLIDTHRINREDFRFFVGYSGWSQGQLEEELRVKSWIVHKRATNEMIFDTLPSQLWKDVLKNIGGKFRVIANYPEDPRLN